jgi:hypothetical protein
MLLTTNRSLLRAQLRCSDLFVEFISDNTPYTLLVRAVYAYFDYAQ